MTRVLSTGKQFVITIPKDLISLMGWVKGTEVLISKFPEKNLLYIEEVKKHG
ncbi:MAG: hypothetical protein GXP63_07135 [DPANN group archaeon]|nr:hypothetical protein [DPANN group archaeon]